MNNLKRTLTLLSASVFLATGCAQMRSVPLNPSAQGMERPAVEPGDEVIVTTRDGAQHRFQVTSVEADALRGERHRIAYVDMLSLNAREPGSLKFGKTALIVGAVVLGAVAIGAASGGGGGGGGY